MQRKGVRLFVQSEACSLQPVLKVCMLKSVMCSGRVAAGRGPRLKSATVCTGGATAERGPRLKPATVCTGRVAAERGLIAISFSFFHDCKPSLTCHEAFLIAKSILLEDIITYDDSLSDQMTRLPRKKMSIYFYRVMCVNICVFK